MKTQFSFFAVLFALLFTVPFSAFGGKYETTITAFWASVDNGHFDHAVTYLHADLQVVLPLSPTALNREAYRQLGEGFRMGFPDISHKVLEVTEGKMTAAVRGIFSGTNTGPLMGNPPTGNRVELPFLQYWTFDSEGRAVRIEIAFDLAAFNAQLMGGDPNAKVEMAKQNIRSAYDALNRKDWNAFAMLCDEKTYTDVNVAPTPVVGVWQALELYKGFFSAFTNFKITVQEIAPISAERYLLRVNLAGTHTGNLMGVPATNKYINYNDVDIVVINAQGKIVHHEPTKGGSEVFRLLGVDPGSPTEQNKQTVLQIMQHLDKRNLNAVTAACTADCRFNGWGPQPMDSNGYKQAMSALIASFPDARFIVEDVIAAGDKVVVRHRFEGTHTGAAFQGTPQSGKRAIAPATVTFQLKDGKPEELWLNADFLGILVQIGAVPAPKM